MLERDTAPQENHNGTPKVSVEDLGPTPNQDQKQTMEKNDQILERMVAPKPPVKTESVVTGVHTQSFSPMPKKRFSIPKKWQKPVIGLLAILLFFTLVGGVLGFYTYSVGTKLKTQAQEAATTGQNAYTNFKAQNLPASEAELVKLEGQLTEIRSTYNQLAFYRFIPLAGSYYADGIHGLNAADAGIDAALKSVTAISPYADVLGFSGEGTFEGGSAENRVKLILETLEKVTPVLDEISAELETVETELAQINPNRYPETFRGIAIRSQFEEAQKLLSQASNVLTNYRPFIEKLPEIAGAGEERKKYLVLFMNDNELRPTGGFLTAYAVIFIQDGVVTPEKSDDIYQLDQKYNGRLEIPEQLGRYLTTERYWNLRDMNTSPDFKTSMDQFYSIYQELPGEPDNIDGIIAVDTHVLTDLIRIVGPVEVPGYGTFSAETDPRCDCPQIIYALSEIITRPTPYLRQDRKGILAPLMQSILQKLYASPRVFMADLFESGLENVKGKHMQVYFFDEAHQQAAEAINAAGRLQTNENAEDFLAIVNANLGGAKSNLFINYEATQEVSAPENGQIEKSLEVTYRNSRHGDNCNLEAGLLCLNATNRDWTRIYVPQGSVLVDTQGFTDEVVTYEENGFTVFEGFFTLEPNSQAKIKLTYTVPYSDNQNYRVKIWKQGGISPVPMIMDVTGGQEEILVDGDILYQTEF